MRLIPRTTPIRRTIPITAVPHILPIPITLSVGIDASPLTLHTCDWLWRADDDALNSVGKGLHKRFLAVAVEGALREGVVVGGVDDVDVEAVV